MTKKVNTRFFGFLLVLIIFFISIVSATLYNEFSEDFEDYPLSNYTCSDFNNIDPNVSDTTSEIIIYNGDEYNVGFSDYADCQLGTDESGIYNIQSNGSLGNRQYGSSIGQNEGMILEYYFNGGLYLDTTSYIQYDLYQSSDSDANPMVLFYFVNTTSANGYGYCNAYRSINAPLTATGWAKYCRTPSGYLNVNMTECLVDFETAPKPTGQFRTRNILNLDSCPASPLNESYDRMFFIIMGRAGGVTYGLDNLVIGNITLNLEQVIESENNLPTLTFDYDDQICYNTTTNNALVSIDVTGTDVENDVIYYSTDITNVLRTFLFWEEDFKNQWGWRDYSYLDDEYFYYLNSSQVYDYQYEEISCKVFGLFCKDIISHSYQTVDGSNVEWLDIPTGSEPLFWVMKDTIPSDWLYSGNMWFDEGPVNIELRIADARENWINNWTIFKNATNEFQIFVDGVQYTDNIYADTDDVALFYTDFDDSTDITRFYFRINGTEILINKSWISDEPYTVMYVVNARENRSYVGLTNLQMEGFNYVDSPVWSTTPKEEFVINYTWTDKVYYYVTDSVHINNDYREYLIDLDIDEAYCYDDDEINTSDTGTTSGEDLGDDVGDSFISKTFRGFFGSFVNDVGKVQLFYSIFWILFFILLIIGFVVLGSISRSLKMTSLLMTVYGFVGLGSLWQTGVMGFIFIISINRELAEVFN